MALLNRLLAALIGLALLVAGLLLAVEAVLAAAGRPGLLVRRDVAATALQEATWSDPALLVVGVVLIAVGLLILLLQLVPQIPHELPLNGTPERAALVDRKAMEQRLRERALGDREVVAARVASRRHSLRVKAKAQPGADLTSVRARLQASTDDFLGRLGLARTPRTRVRVGASRERSP